MRPAKTLGLPELAVASRLIATSKEIPGLGSGKTDYVRLEAGWPRQAARARLMTDPAEVS